MANPKLDPVLAEALSALAARVAAARQPWWVIGSAAVALHGADTKVADIDLLMAPEDAQALLGDAAAARCEATSALFRSRVFGTVGEEPYRVEIMADLTVNTESGWRPVTLATREPARVGGATLWVPAREELIELLRLFGREKDLARAALLDALPPG